MILLDWFWSTKKEWCHFENGKLVVNKDAPCEAQESYKRFLEQQSKVDQHPINHKS